MTEKYHEHNYAKLFEYAIEIEHKSINFYLKLSRLFSHIPDISAFWEDLAKEEKKHEDTLKEIYNSLAVDQLLLTPNEQLMEKVIEIRNLLTGDLIGSIKNLNDAYEKSHELEFFEVESIFKFLATQFITSGERKEFLLSEIKEHQGRLMEFSKKFGNKATRKQIAIRID